MEKQNYQMHGLASQDLCLLNERPPDGYTCSGDRLTRKQTTSRPDNVCGNTCLMQQKAKRSKSGYRETKDRYARQIRGIFFLESDEEFKPTMKNARRKLEIPMPAAMPCKTPVNCRGKTCSSIGKSKTKSACIVDANESVRIRLEGTPQRYHEDHIAAKGINSLSHHHLVHKFFPMPQA